MLLVALDSASLITFAQVRLPELFSTSVGLEPALVSCDFKLQIVFPVQDGALESRLLTEATCARWVFILWLGILSQAAIPTLPPAAEKKKAKP